MSKIATLFLPFALFSGNAFTAEQVPLEITVTANRYSTQQKSASSTQVLTSSDIQQRGISTLSHALEQFNGVKVARNGSVGSATSIFVRGSNSNHTIVLLDGQRLTSTTDGKTEIEYIPLNIVDRIEFVSGSLSTIYGSDAIGGVINIFTKPASSTTSRQLTFAIGNGHTEGSLSSSGAINEDTLYRLNLGQEYTSGYDVANVYSNADDDGYANKHLDLAIQRRIGAFTVEGSAAQWRGKTEFDEDPINFAFDNTTDFVTSRAGLNMNYIGTNYDLQSSINKINNDRFNYDSSNPSQRSKTSLDRLEWTNIVSHYFDNDLEVSSGFDLRDEKASSTYATGTNSTKGLFGAIKKSFDSLHLDGSLRRDYQSHYGYKTSWATGLTLDITEDLDVFITRKSAYANPTLADLDPKWGNPGLLPEDAKTTEFGLRFRPTADLKGEILLYDTKYNNLIEFKSFKLANIGEARGRGLELNLTKRLNAVDLKANYAYLDSENLDNGGAPLINRASHEAKLSAAYRINDKTNFNIGYHYTGDMTSLDAVNYTSKKMPNYGLWNAAMSHKVNDQVSLEVSIDNLLNKNYQPVDGFNGRKRYGEARLRYNF